MVRMDLGRQLIPRSKVVKDLFIAPTSRCTKSWNAEGFGGIEAAVAGI